MTSVMVAERQIGQYPLSIATSLALESVAGIHPEISYPYPPLKDVAQLWVNLRTLYRNLMGSMPRDAEGTIAPADLAEAITMEMEQIRSIVRDVTQGRAKAIFYVCNYAGMEQKYRRAVVRRDSTDKQKMFTHFQNATIKLILENFHGDDLFVYERKLKPQQRVPIMLLTHYAYDLLSAREFTSVTLLESHTGALKKPHQWYTKYYNGKELHMFPFREDLLQVFGDSETFRPMDIKLRRELIDIATEYKWSPLTTTDKIRYSIDKVKNPLAKEILRSLLV